MIYKVKILTLSETYYPHYGGAELASHLYSKHLQEKGHRIIVVTDRLQGEPRVTGSSDGLIYRLNLIEGYSPKYSIMSRFDVLKSSFFRKLVHWADLVYIPRYWFTAIPYVKSLGKPVVVHLHDYIPVCPLSNLFDASRGQLCESKGCKASCIWATERNESGPKKAALSTIINTIAGTRISRLVGKADAIICVSGKHREVLLSKAPSLRDKTHVIYNPMPEVNQIDLLGNDFGFFGGKGKFKGFHILYKALGSLDQSSRKDLRIQATQMLGLSEEQREYVLSKGMVLFGRLDSEAFNSMYSQVQTVLVPSIWHEPLPYVVAEALTRGRLVIASEIGGIPELLEGCDGAVMFEPGNWIQLADAIDYFMYLDQEEKKELGEINRENFSKKFSTERSIQDFLKLAHSII